MVRVGLMVVGIVLVAAGVALGPIPVVPGFPLVILGVLLITMSSAAARRQVNALEKRLPQKMRDTIKRVLRVHDGHAVRDLNHKHAAQTDHSPMIPMEPTDSTALHPEDRAFLERRYSSAPLIFGVVSIVTAPIVLGMLPGALGLRAGVDLWRRGLRKPLIGLGIAVSGAGVVASIVLALVWGSILAGVLLGRDAMREAERWRGLKIDSFVCEGMSASGESEFTIPNRGEGVERTILLFVSTDTDPSKDALATLAPIVGECPTARLLVLDPNQSAARVGDFVRGFDLDAGCVGEGARFPHPLDHVAAFPTMIVVNTDGVVEFALVGARSPDELRSVVSGEAARKAKEIESARRDARESGGGGG